MITPSTSRTRDRPVVSMATSRRAARGSTRDALTAGPTLAATVTITPSAMPVSTVSLPNAAPSPGSGKPMESIRAPSPAARPTPATRPSAEATTPTASDSTIVDTSTWRREAPSARRSADSRLRWATTMEKVL
jgi:hypothetical protein